MFKQALRAAPAAAAILIALTGSAGATNLITNGDFAANNLTNYAGPGISQTYRYAVAVNGATNTSEIAGWTYNVPGGNGANNGGLLTVMSSNNLNSDFNMVDTCCNLGFWGSSNGGLATLTAPPSGDANVMAQDSAPENAAYLSQTINGLTPGAHYRLTFDFAGLQLYGFNGAVWNGDTNEGAIANLGGTYDTSAPGGTASQAFVGGQTDTYVYAGYTNAVPSHGFTGWQSVAMDFTATSASEVLNLEAISTSAGEPPFALIDNVQMFSVPEPASWSLMVIGAGVLGGFARRRRALVPVAAA